MLIESGGTIRPTCLQRQREGARRVHCRHLSGFSAQGQRMHSLQRSFFSCSDNSDMEKFFLVQSQNVLPYSFYPFVSVSDTTLLHIVAREITDDRHSSPPSASHRFPLPPVHLTILLRTHNNRPYIPTEKGAPQVNKQLQKPRDKCRGQDAATHFVQRMYVF